MSLVPQRSRPLGWVVVIILFAAAGILLWMDINKWNGAGAPRSGRAVVGGPAPDVTVTSMDGKPAHLSSFYGKPLVLNFFATWCIPCKAELPMLESRYRSLRSKGLIIVGVDQQEELKPVQAFTRSFGITYPVVVDAGEGTNTYDIHAIPTSVFVDAKGIVQAIHVGELSVDGLDADLNKILH